MIKEFEYCELTQEILDNLKHSNIIDADKYSIYSKELKESTTEYHVNTDNGMILSRPFAKAFTELLIKEINKPNLYVAK